MTVTDRWVLSCKGDTRTQGRGLEKGKTRVGECYDQGLVKYRSLILLNEQNESYEPGFMVSYVHVSRVLVSTRDDEDESWSH